MDTDEQKRTQPTEFTKKKIHLNYSFPLLAQFFLSGKIHYFHSLNRMLLVPLVFQVAAGVNLPRRTREAVLTQAVAVLCV